MSRIALTEDVREHCRFRSTCGYFTITERWFNSLDPDLQAVLKRWWEERNQGFTPPNFDPENPGWTLNNSSCSLVSINDDGGSFSLIARIIASNPPGLFAGNEQEA